ncbi:MAG: hypothetical protein FJW31_03600 [Acidobacteria bacterium]|nr:hypothetical protein [Acidobacteriota bacterium]
MTIAPARRAAFDILKRVETQGAFAADLLAALPGSMDRRDLNLATELVMGCLRKQNQLDFLVAHFSGRPAPKFDAEVRVALRLGAYQLRHLDRIPRSAAVNDSVSLTRSSGKGSAAGFVNAVLRKVDSSPVKWPSGAVATALPEWLHARWLANYGGAATARLADAASRAPETYIHVPAGRETEVPEGAERTELAGCYKLPPGAGPGPFWIQDIGSQALVPLLELSAGQRFLDLCAAPGNKTAQALEAGARTVACDHSVKRLHAVQSLGCPLVALNAERPLPFAGRPFDRILVDAPCSGTGTLGRNPEIRWRLQPSDIERHRARQVEILTRALAVLAPGGRLVYSTCSLEPEENEAVVRQALMRVGPSFALGRTVQRLPGREPGDGFFAAVIKSSVPRSV